MDTVSYKTINEGQNEYQDKCLAQMSRMSNAELENICEGAEINAEILKLHIRIRELEDKQKIAGFTLMQCQKEIGKQVSVKDVK